MPDLSKTSAGVAASSAAWGWLRRKSSIKNRKSLCHCERSEAISLHHSLFLVLPSGMAKPRHSIFTTTFAFLLLLFLIASPAHAKYGGGTGEPNDPYLIYDANQMNAIGADANDWDKHFILMADIDLAGYTRTAFNIIPTFSGVFDGNGHTISNFTYSSTGTNCIGLFGYVRGEIKDLGLINPDVDAGSGDKVGSLVGRLSGGTITNCYVEGGSVAGDDQVGSLAGINCGSASNCFSTGDVVGNESVGGLVGAGDGSLLNCYSTGSVSGYRYVGGLVGRSDLSGIISNCYSTGDVNGVSVVGGLVGGNYFVDVLNCYSTGDVTGNEYVGGLVGENRNGDVSNCFWDIETSGLTTSAGGTGLPTDQMQMASTFLCWGYEPVWTIDEGVDYPRLVWENKPGELITVPTDLYGGGTGEPEDPYLIYTAEQLNKIGLVSCHLDKHFKLMADVDLGGFTGTSFNFIGTDYYNPFTGVFDGNGHTISNFSYTSTGRNYIGLFGYVRGVIKNLGLIDTNIDAGTGDYVGSLVGWFRDGTIANCYAEGGSVSGAARVGGLAGRNWGTINNCYSEGIVSGDDFVGGLVGSNGGTINKCYSTASGVIGNRYVGGLVGLNNGTIANSYSTGSVTAEGEVGGLVGLNSGTITNCHSTGSVSGESQVGGLVGSNGIYGPPPPGNSHRYGTISNCYSTGSVWGTTDVGGLVGINEGWFGAGSTIRNCYSTASVSGDRNVGGLVGHNYRGEITDSFWDIETSGQTTSAGGTGLPTAEMQTMSTFTDAGWDFVGETVNGIEDIWFIPQQDYPHLWWEGMQVSMKLTPRTLNCRSKGNWVKAHLILPEGFTVADVDSNTPAVLHSFGFESAPLHVFVNENELVEIEAAFERGALCSLTGDWPEALTVAGFLTDGNIFLGTSTVRMIAPGLKDIAELSLYWLNADCVHPDFCNGIDMNRDSLVNLLDYALLLNSQVEFIRE